MDDDQLLRDYVKRRSENAFTELVNRHINLVYSAALRIVQDPGTARDVTQSVFILLARKATTVRSGASLPGWLYRVARCQSINAIRSERTRREHEAMAMNPIEFQPQNDPVWESVMPHLDDAMHTLSAAEQNAIVLRFFEGHSWREVGTALALTEDTAQKRVSRALEKLRACLQRRGVVASTVLIGSVISANAIQAAPIGIAHSIAATSVAVASTATTFSVFTTYIQTLFMKKTACILVSAAITAGVAVPLVVVNANNSEKPITAESIREGLVLHFPFNRDEGEVVTDTSPAHNNGTIVGAEWTYDPIRGGAFRFGPPDQYIVVPNSDSLNPTNLTLAAWIKTENTNGTWRRVFDKSWTNGYALSVAGGHTSGNKFVGRGVFEICKTGSAGSDQLVADGQWHHLAVTFDGKAELFYVDGVQQKKAGHVPVVMAGNPYNLTIGINLVDPNPEYDEVGASFDGLIDEPMIFQRSLSAPEIQFLYNSQKPEVQ